jgi:hypothetical protein
VTYEHQAIRVSVLTQTLQGSKSVSTLAVEDVRVAGFKPFDRAEVAHTFFVDPATLYAALPPVPVAPDLQKLLDEIWQFTHATVCDYFNEWGDEFDEEDVLVLLSSLRPRLMPLLRERIDAFVRERGAR